MAQSRGKKVRVSKGRGLEEYSKIKLKII